ncbi:uncharacterized protein PHALS_05093 [Plasmopara halstedii]|uniref:Uncharacterized protein n=1 Tax=Plasmopara halstedii TaxID=4781 RepID=A0A0P1B2E5_PLAHL|nr:uncharacterized protein PHALS_05093 [Plasmopara halstedii]CEG47756.1 hypothetical protein PHALS_05093 [Plasmopara halstedii]|eukprot:XP_024584125.1 hypothetical protein PHALS_05093 [Plasmopara halstedii]
MTANITITVAKVWFLKPKIDSRALTDIPFVAISDFCYLYIQNVRKGFSSELQAETDNLKEYVYGKCEGRLSNREFA